jgi:hypothetical protein
MKFVTIILTSSFSTYTKTHHILTGYGPELCVWGWGSSPVQNSGLSKALAGEGFETLQVQQTERKSSRRAIYQPFWILINRTTTILIDNLGAKFAWANPLGKLRQHCSDDASLVRLGFIARTANSKTVCWVWLKDSQIGWFTIRHSLTTLQQSQHELSHLDFSLISEDERGSRIYGTQWKGFLGMRGGDMCDIFD